MLSPCFSHSSLEGKGFLAENQKEKRDSNDSRKGSASDDGNEGLEKRKKNLRSGVVSDLKKRLIIFAMVQREVVSDLKMPKMGKK